MENLVVFLLEDRRILLRSPPRILSTRVLASPGACDRQAGLLVSKGDFQRGREAEFEIPTAWLAGSLI